MVVLFCFAFFRSPERKTPDGPNALLMNGNKIALITYFQLAKNEKECSQVA